MAYDKQKAHEYYMKYRKKGLLKGREKGKAKTKSSKAKKAKQENLLGISTSGLTEKGKIEADLIKEDMKKQMNEALAKATTDEERQQIKREYSLKAVEKINELKSNPDYATEKKTKEKTSKEKASSEKTSTATEKKVSEKEVERLNKTIKDLSSKVEKLTTEQEQQVKTILADILRQLKTQTQQIDKRL